MDVPPNRAVYVRSMNFPLVTWNVNAWDMRKTYRILVGNPEGIRPLGRPR